DQLWNRAHEIAATIAANPPSATQGTVKAIWESLDKPYRAAMEQGLIYTRLGNPLGQAELADRADGPAVERRSRGTVGIPRITRGAGGYPVSSRCNRTHQRSNTKASGV